MAGEHGESVEAAGGGQLSPLWAMTKARSALEACCEAASRRPDKALEVAQLAGQAMRVAAKAIDRALATSGQIQEIERCGAVAREIGSGSR